MNTEVALTVVPRNAVRFPLPMPEPPGFDPGQPETWPKVPGRLEYVGGRLLFTPPCGQPQQRIAISVAVSLGNWQLAHPEFVVGGNEAGILLGGETRGADAAVFRATPATPGYARTAPVLAVEITGEDEELDVLLTKAEWYLGHGVAIVWIVDPPSRTVTIVTSAGRVDVTDRIPESPLLPGLSPLVADFFRQL